MNLLLRFLLRVLVLAGIIYVVTRFVDGIDVIPGTSSLGETGTYVWIALLFGLVNTVLGPIVRLLSLPFIILTLGLFLLVVNAAMLAITAGISDRLTVDGFGSAVLGGLLIAVFGWVAELLLPLRSRS